MKKNYFLFYRVTKPSSAPVTPKEVSSPAQVPLSVSTEPSSPSANTASKFLKQNLKNTLTIIVKKRYIGKFQLVLKMF